MDYERVRIQEENFSVEDEIKCIKQRSKRIGAVVFALGVARDFSKGKNIVRLDYEHYPGMAEKRLGEIRDRALQDYDVIEISIVHRVGRFAPGENLVLLVVAAEHRKDAFRACEWCFDELKRITPIWKKEETNKGEVWVVEHP